MFTKIKVNVCYAIKIYKNKPKNIFKQGGRAPGAPVLDPPLRSVELDLVLERFPSRYDLLNPAEAHTNERERERERERGGGLVRIQTGRSHRSPLPKKVIKKKIKREGKWRKKVSSLRGCRSDGNSSKKKSSVYINWQDWK